MTVMLTDKSGKTDKTTTVTSNTFDAHKQPFENKPSETAGQTQYSYDDDLGELISLPWLENYPFHFDQYVNDIGLTYNDEDRERWQIVSDRHLPVGKALTDDYAHSRCQFLNIETTAENVAIQMKEIKNHKTQFDSVCKNFLENFFVNCAIHLDITYDGGKTVENWSHILTSFCQCICRADVEKFVILMYLSFDFIKGYRENLTKAVLRQMGLRLYPRNNSNRSKAKERKRISCFESIASVILNGYCRSLNRMGPRSCGWTITNVRPDYVLDQAKENEYRDEKVLYKWMINGVQVKFNILFYLYFCFCLLIFLFFSPKFVQLT